MTPINYVCLRNKKSLFAHRHSFPYFVPLLSIGLTNFLLQFHGNLSEISIAGIFMILLSNVRLRMENSSISNEGLRSKLVMKHVMMEQLWVY